MLFIPLWHNTISSLLFTAELKERRDTISAAFGLDELTALKTALDGARKSFNLSPPVGVEQARAKLRPLASVLDDFARN